MRERVATATRGLVSLAALVLVLAGPPVALIGFVGNPLPSELPGLGEIGDALTRTGIDDRTIIKILALLAWLVWLQIAAAVLTEVAAQIRSRPAPSLPVLPGFQPAARHLIAGVVLIAALAGPARPASSAAAAPAPVAALAGDPTLPQREAAQPSTTLTTETPAPAAGPATTEYLVQRHDSLWSIAEDVLGDGYRWREIRDLNVGKPQPGGQALTATSDVINPGWILDVPDREAQSATPTAVPAAHTVERGEHLWEIAEDTLETALGREASDAEIDPYWREVIEQNRADLPDPGNPNLIHPGHSVHLPTLPGHEALPAEPAEEVPDPGEPVDEAEASPASSAPPVSLPAAPTSTSTSTPADTPEHLNEADSAETDEKGESQIGFVTGVLGVAGTGLAAVSALKLARRRRDRQARAAPGHVVPATPDELLDTHREVVARADLDQHADVRAGLAEVARHLAGRRRARCRPRLVQVDGNRIDVLLEEPDVNPPPGWTAEASGQVWARQRDDLTDAEEASVAPLLATLGRPDGTTEILYDLEGAGTTSVTGDAAAAVPLVRSLLYEIVHQADEVSVVAVGDIPVPDDSRVRAVATWDEVADDALAWAQVSERALRANKVDSVFIARGMDRSIDGTVPLLLVVDWMPEDPRFEDLLDLARRGAAVAVLIVSGESAPGTKMVLEGDRLTVPSLGLELERQGIDAGTADEIDALVEAADRPPEPPEESEPTEPEGAPAVQPSPNGEPYTDPHFEVLVRVLGQIDAEGGHEPLTPKQLGLLTFIATHPGCSAEQVEEALWPDPISTRRHRLHITLSQVRSAIGSQHLPPFEDEGSYRVSETVRTDLDLFERRIRYADGRSADEAIPILRGALELVTGPPFSYNSRARGSFAWVDTEHWMSTTEASVVQSAWDLWQLYADAGDYDGAIWAAHRGLLASPTNTELTNCLLRAYTTRGDQGAAERVYRSHVRALDRLDLGEPEDSTVELWDELTECASGQPD